MKSGKSLVELATEVQAQAERKQDFKAPAGAIELWKNGTLALTGKAGPFHPTTICHNQMAQYTQIPKAYYDRMLSEDPGLLAANVNTWMRKAGERCENRLVRTVGNSARALLSDRYRILDNDEILSFVLPALMDLGLGSSLEIASCEVTERRLYLKAFFPKVEGEVAKGDIIRAGFVISNSEVGLGGFSVYPAALRLVCLNGLILQEDGQKKYHIGRRLSAGDSGLIYKDETLAADDRALMLTMRDTITAIAADVEGSAFRRGIGRMKALAGEKIEGDIPKVVEVAAKRFNLLDTERGSVLRHLIEGGDLSRYGLMNAITRSAEDAPSYDRATELEVLGGQVIDLPTSAWKEIEKQAA